MLSREQANRDVDETVTHYLSGAGEAAALGFIDILEKAYAHVVRDPATGSPRYAHVFNLPGPRTCSLTRYPHLVFYVERPDHIDVWRARALQRSQWDGRVRGRKPPYHPKRQDSGARVDRLTSNHHRSRLSAAFDEDGDE